MSFVICMDQFSIKIQILDIYMGQNGTSICALCNIYLVL